MVTLDQSTQELKQLQSRLAAANSAAPIIARVDRSNFELGIRAMREGALSVISTAPFDAAEWAEVLELAQCQPAKNNSQPAFVFADPVSRNLLALAERVAQVDVTVSGHRPNRRRQRSLGAHSSRCIGSTSGAFCGLLTARRCRKILLKICCSAMRKGLSPAPLKSSLVYLNRLEGGTVFLDEIGEMSFHLQAKLTANFAGALSGQARRTKSH